VWLVERQVWRVMADRSQRLERHVARQRCKEIGKSPGGIASNEENRHTRLEECIRGVIKHYEKIKTTGATVSRQLHGEMDWMVWNWDDKLKNYVFELTDPVDTIILGRKMTDGFVSYWSGVMTKPDDPFYAFAKKMIETPKVVFTKTLKNRSGQIRTLRQATLRKKS
jgi:hypothetical protein